MGINQHLENHHGWEIESQMKVGLSFGYWGPEMMLQDCKLSGLPP